MEVMGFEPTASTLRMSMSRPFNQGIFQDLPGRGLSIPSGSLMIPPLSSRLGQVRSRPHRVGRARNWRSLPIGRRSQCAANGTRSPWATITFLGEQQDIIDHEAAIIVAWQTTKGQSSVRQQPVDDPVGLPTRSPAGDEVADPGLHGGRDQAVGIELNDRRSTSSCTRKRNGGWLECRRPVVRTETNQPTDQVSRQRRWGHEVWASTTTQLPRTGQRGRCFRNPKGVRSRQSAETPPPSGAEWRT